MLKSITYPKWLWYAIAVFAVINTITKNEFSSVLLGFITMLVLVTEKD